MIAYKKVRNWYVVELHKARNVSYRMLTESLHLFASCFQQHSPVVVETEGCCLLECARAGSTFIERRCLCLTAIDKAEAINKVFFATMQSIKKQTVLPTLPTPLDKFEFITSQEPDI